MPLLLLLGTWEEGPVEPQKVAVCSPCSQGMTEGKGAAGRILASVCHAPNTDCTKILASSLFNWLGLWRVLENKFLKRVSLVVKSHPLPMAPMEALIFHGEIWPLGNDSVMAPRNCRSCGPAARKSRGLEMFVPS